MKKHLLTGTLLAVAACGLAFAGDKDKEKKAPVNKFCAVMQEHEIDPAVTIEYKDKTIGFCCKDCIPDFKKDPEKYIKTMK